MEFNRSSDPVRNKQRIELCIFVLKSIENRSAPTVNILGSALAIFTSCLFIDELRRFLFKILYIENVIRKVETFFPKLQDSVDRIFYRLFSR